MHLATSRRRVIAGALMVIVAPSLEACGSSGSTAPTATTSSAFLAPTATPLPPVPTPSPTVAPTDTPAPSPTPVRPTPTPAPQGMTSPDFGVQVFLWGSAQAQRDLSLANEGGFRWIKQSIEWRYVEPHVKGTLEFNEPDRLVGLATQLNLKMIARLDNQPVWARSDKIFPASGPPDKNQDYVDFVHVVASRYKGKIQAYEIWNEPNLAVEWGGKPPDPVAYVALLKAAYTAIKDADPDALVISAGLAPTTASGAIAMPDVDFIRQMYKAGASKYFDLLGAHGAGYKAPPEMSPDDVSKDPTYNHGEGTAGRIYCFRHIEEVRKIMVDNGDSKKRLAVLEFGWTTDNRPNSPYKWHAVTEQQQADYYVGAFKWAAEHWQPWIGTMSAIYIASPTWTPNDEEYFWSITKPDGTVRPAYTALAAMAK
jgi:polysaccharide biosynthesis protein PslG